MQLLESSCLLTTTVVDLNLQCRNSSCVLLNQDSKFHCDSVAEKYKTRVLNFYLKSMLILCCLNVNLSPCPQVNCTYMFSQEILMRIHRHKL